MTPKHLLTLLLAASFTGFVSAGLYSPLAVRYYAVDTGYGSESAGRVRIALITDLHSCRYGKEQQKLLGAIDAQNPDIICMSGDIFDDRLSDDGAEIFIAAAAKKYPCWYVTGNHEYRDGKSAFDRKMEILDRYGVKRLGGECDTVEINGKTINLCGIDDLEAYLIHHETDAGSVRTMPEQLSDIASLADNGYYTVLLAHRPEFIDMYAEKGFDLALCGHAHGGQWRIPGLLNGFFAPNQGFFPKYAGGRYDVGDTVMIVSRGLAKESTFLPRFYNCHEVVIIDLE